MSSAVDFAYPRRAEVQTLEASIDNLLEQSHGRQVGFDERAECLGQLSRLILAPDSALREKLPTEGLAFLAAFLGTHAIRGLIERELKDLRSLREFVPVAPRKSLRVVPKGLVCHWVAGNVPLLALFSWALSAVLGNRNLIRLSSRQVDSVSPLLDALASLSNAGDVMAKETHVVLFDRDNKEAHAVMSRAADTRIAWGGREAVDAIRDLPASWHCNDVIFGPRMSLAVVDPEVIGTGGIRRLACDVSFFDQLACSSPQLIFVKGGRASAVVREFVTEFTESFASQSAIYPRHKLDFSETYQINLDRARAVLEGAEVHQDEFTSWTVAVVDAPRPNLQCANRFVQLVPFRRLEDLYAHIPANIQTVVTELSPEDTQEFTEQAAHLGVCRFPRPGEGNHFENPWDGIGLVSRLTRAVIRTEAAD